MKVRNILSTRYYRKEINNVVEVLKSGWITTGPKTKKI